MVKSRTYIIKLYLVLLVKSSIALTFLIQGKSETRKISFSLMKQLFYLSTFINFYWKRKQFFGHIFKKFKVKMVNYFCSQEKLLANVFLKKLSEDKCLMKISHFIFTNEVFPLVFGANYIKKIIESSSILFLINENIVFKNIFYSSMCEASITYRNHFNIAKLLISDNQCNDNLRNKQTFFFCCNSILFDVSQENNQYLLDMKTEDLLEVSEDYIYSGVEVDYDLYEDYLFLILLITIFPSLFFFSENDELFLFDWFFLKWLILFPSIFIYIINIVSSNFNDTWSYTNLAKDSKNIYILYFFRELVKDPLIEFFTFYTLDEKYKKLIDFIFITRRNNSFFLIKDEISIKNLGSSGLITSEKKDTSKIKKQWSNVWFSNKKYLLLNRRPEAFKEMVNVLCDQFKYKNNLKGSFLQEKAMYLFDINVYNQNNNIGYIIRDVMDSNITYLKDFYNIVSIVNNDTIINGSGNAEINDGNITSDHKIDESEEIADLYIPVSGWFNCSFMNSCYLNIKWKIKQFKMFFISDIKETLFSKLLFNNLNPLKLLFNNLNLLLFVNKHFNNTIINIASIGKYTDNKKLFFKNKNIKPDRLKFLRYSGHKTLYSYYRILFKVITPKFALKFMTHQKLSLVRYSKRLRPSLLSLVKSVRFQLKLVFISNDFTHPYGKLMKSKYRPRRKKRKVIRLW